MAVSALRAAHQTLDAHPLILEDPVVEQLLDPDTVARMQQHADRLQSNGARALRAHMVTRSRYAEDRLQAAVSDRAIHQYVILGAGFDTFGYRQPAWTGGLRIFEVDQPATQSEKQSRVAAAGIGVPDNLTFVAVDFEHDRLSDRLQSAGFDARQPAFFSWLGVAMYLDESANDDVFRFVASLAKGSELVFTFATAEREGVESPVAALAAAGGEPWRCYYEPDALAGHLRDLGYSHVVMPTPQEIAAAYYLNRPDDLPLPRRRFIVSAIV